MNRISLLQTGFTVSQGLPEQPMYGQLFKNPVTY